MTQKFKYITYFNFKNFSLVSEICDRNLAEISRFVEKIFTALLISSRFRKVENPSLHITFWVRIYHRVHIQIFK